MRYPILTAAFLVALGSWACGGGGEQSSAAHQHDSASVSAVSAPVVIPPGAMFIEADVRFMQGMIPHHGQAVAMTALAVRQKASPALILFAQKMDLSQRAEIDRMSNWLWERNQAIPDSTAHQHVQMPGMLTPEQFRQLETAKGKEFDRLFLTLMIQHHEGAIKMVADLNATPLSMQDFVISALASDIDADQRAEIHKMYSMLEELR